jgi:glycosyltransferase involved in cell wall biosynthesis
MRWLYALEGRRMAAVEAALCRACDVSVVVNDRERVKLERRVRGLRAFVAPTTVDPREYAALADRPLTPEPVIGFVGSMFYPPNERAVLWFARYVWPLVRERVRDARWRIVGARPTQRVRQLGGRPGIEVTGAVEDVRPHLGSMRVFVDPVDGDLGVQSKLIVAMAAGRPSVATPDAAAGIVPGDPPPFLVAASPRGFADAVIRLLRDDARARALAARARRFATEHYGVEAIGARWERWLAGSHASPTRTIDARAAAVDSRDMEAVVTR